MNLESLNGTIVVMLRELKNLSTGNPGTQDVWCYMDYPREDVSVPRISVTQSGGGMSPLAIGERIPNNTYGTQQETMYDIDIWVKQGTSLTLPSGVPDSGLKKGGTQLRDYIGDLVISKILDKKRTICVNDLVDIEISSIMTQPFVDDFEWLRKTITIRVIHIQTHA